MNKQMSFYGLFFGCILFLSNAVAIAQTKLTPKDLAFISFNTDGNKNFDFISLVNLTAGTEIRFTDNAYVSGSGLKTNEGILIYTAPGLVTKGTVISYSGVIGGDWVLGDAGFNPSGSGDNILVYQGSEESPTFIFGIGGARSSPWISSVPTNNNSNIPETLSEASHTIVSLGAGDNYQYDTSFGNSGNASELLILITEPTHFTRNDAIAFSPITSSFVITDPTWTGNTNTDWALSSNWLNGLPTSSLNAYLPKGRLNYPIITATSSADCNHLFLESSAELTINSNSGNSGSIIVKGTSEGNITYNRYVSGSKWHLLASPVSGQAIGSLLLNATNAISVSGSYYNMKAYQEDLDNWGTRFTSSISGIFTSGKGYATQRNSDGLIRFSGSIITDDLSVNLSRNNNGWNLIGNPYTSSIGASLSAGTLDYCLSDANCNELDDSYAALYLWDEQSAYSGNRNDYRVINNAGNGSLIQNYIQAGQGFFVKAKSGGGSFHFTPSMRVHKTSTPIKSDFNLWSSIVLKATTEQISQTTYI